MDLTKCRHFFCRNLHCTLLSWTSVIVDRKWKRCIDTAIYLVLKQTSKAMQKKLHFRNAAFSYRWQRELRLNSSNRMKISKRVIRISVLEWSFLQNSIFRVCLSANSPSFLLYHKSWGTDSKTGDIHNRADYAQTCYSRSISKTVLGKSGLSFNREVNTGYLITTMLFPVTQ